ncbi:MAG: chitobiase/beta-hexosaminidase C-terminal domain-containing protein [Kiritimatiellae bacterium]|nr:chitobiase/beta-hexosaminidase C-terminal domain-containing protein [Kiritimatiellia bacterium]
MRIVLPVPYPVAAFVLLSACAAVSTCGRTVTAIRQNDAWKYFAPGNEPEPAWRDCVAEDNNWPSLSAPLGFGETWISNTVPAGDITYYFRKTFTILDDPAGITNLTLSANYDDGFVAYLNGAEVLRGAMPTGTVEYGTLASSHEGGSYEVFDISAHAGALLPNRNVLAVEVHQTSLSSSDVVMDMTLRYEVATAMPSDSLVEWVWAGAVTTHSVTINAKLRAESATVRALASTSPDLSGAVASDFCAADTASNRVVSIVLTGLAPATRYYYGIESAGTVDPYKTGTFRTFPSGPASFTFAAGCGARTAATNAVFDVIAAEDPAFFMHTGDLHYENISENSAAVYRAAYDTILNSSVQAACYRDVPVVYMWDDHDFGPNNSNRTAPGRQAARQAYRECVPHYPLVAGAGNAPIYQAFTCGRVRFLLCDLRSERHPETDPDTAFKSMLGAEQKAWLKQELLEAKDRYPLIVLLSTVPWIAAYQNDCWAGYTTERAELADFIKTNGIPLICMIAGDAHMCAIDDGSHNEYAAGGGPSFPVVQAGSLAQFGSVKGGPYSHGTYPGADRFALVGVTDTGDTNIDVTVTCRENYTVLATHTFSAPAAPVAKPLVEPNGGVFAQTVSVTLTTLTPGASLFYTTDGAEPSTASLAYAAPFALGVGITAIRAKAFLAGAGSAVQNASFDVRPDPLVAPDIAPNGGSFWAPVQVVLATPTAGASIFYTTDGTEPSTFSMLYENPFVLATGTTVVKAKTFRGAESDMTAASFDIFPTARTRIVAIADTRGDSDEAYVNTNVLNAIVTRILSLDPLPDAVTVSGNLVVSPDNADGGYLLFTNCMAPLAEAGIPYYCAIGQDDIRDALWYSKWTATFAFPTNGPAGWERIVYYADAGCARIVALDPFTYGCDWAPGDEYTRAIGAEQRDWLRSIAGTNAALPFDIVFSEGVAFPITYDHKNRLFDCLDQNPLERDVFLQTLSEIKATAHLIGHEHLYVRRNMDARYSPALSHSVPHIGVVSGAPFDTSLVDDVVDPDIIARSTYGFLVLDLDPVSHLGTATAYAEDGTNVLDVVTLWGKKAGQPDVTVPRGSTWKYLKGTAEASDPPTAWLGAAFDDSAWSAGAAQFGYSLGSEEGPFGTTLDDMKGGYNSLYLRKAFNVNQPALAGGAVFWVRYDDGFILWLNGREVARVNVPGEPGSTLAFDALATSQIDVSAWTLQLTGSQIPKLECGTNVLAIHAFNGKRTSSDMVIDAELVLTQRSGVPGDHDADGMTDDWETRFLGGAQTPDGEPDADPDGDGVPNLDEFVSGTDPTNPRSCFLLHVATSNGEVCVTFDALPANGTGYDGYMRRYSLEQKGWPLGGPAASTAQWTSVAGYTNILGGGQQTAYTNSLPDPPVFYRARAWLER